MPSNRKRRSRARSASGGVPENIFRAFCSGLPPLLAGMLDVFAGMTDEEVKAIWKKYRKAVLERDLEQNREMKLPGERPWPVWQWEITEKRRKAGTTTYIGPVNGTKSREITEDVYETNFELLKRLNMLEDWELELGDIRPSDINPSFSPGHFERLIPLSFYKIRRFRK